jgi:hypothetical protein
MIARQVTALLLHATGSADVVLTDSQSSTAWRCQIRNGDLDEFSIIFRVMRAGPELVDAPGDFLLDDTSRPVYLAEGVVVIGTPTEISDAVFRQVHAITAAVFRDFWAADGWHDSPRVSEPLPETARHPQVMPLVITELPAITYSSPAVLSPPLPGDPSALPQETRPVSEQPVTSVVPGSVQGVVPSSAPHIITIGPRTLAVITVLIAIGIALLAYFLTSGQGPADGTVTGHLYRVGGPVRGLLRPWPGTVTLTGPDFRRNVPVGASGAYSVTVPAGSYTVTGHSPLYGSGAGLCRAASVVTVTSGHTTKAEVLCRVS